MKTAFSVFILTLVATSTSNRLRRLPSGMYSMTRYWPLFSA